MYRNNQHIFYSILFIHRLLNMFENTLSNRVVIVNKMAVEIYANTDKNRDDLKDDDFAIKLGVAFKGPIFGLLCGYSITIFMFIMEYIYSFIYY